MGIEQIVLFIGSWFAVGFLVALAVGTFLREAGRLGRMEIELPARGARARVTRRPVPVREKTGTPQTRPDDRPH